jgi:hypothetical protein
MVDEFTFEGCERPQVQLVGLDGNAFSILGRCRSAARKIWNEAQWRKFHDEATADDYDHLLCTVADYFDLIDPDEEEIDDEEGIDYGEEYEECEE